MSNQEYILLLNTMEFRTGYNGKVKRLEVWKVLF